MGLKLFTPDLRAESVLELTPQRLRELGLEALLLDVDCTLKRYPSTQLEPDVAVWLTGLQDSGLAVCLVSNGRQGRIRRMNHERDVISILNRTCTEKMIKMTMRRYNLYRFKI